MIVITAGAKQVPGETRLALEKNDSASILRMNCDVSPSILNVEGEMFHE